MGILTCELWKVRCGTIRSKCNAVTVTAQSCKLELRCSDASFSSSVEVSYITPIVSLIYYSLIPFWKTHVHSIAVFPYLAVHTNVKSHNNLIAQNVLRNSSQCMTRLILTIFYFSQKHCRMVFKALTSWQWSEASEC